MGTANTFMEMTNILIPEMTRKLLHQQREKSLLGINLHLINSNIQQTCLQATKESPSPVQF